ncbi:hypothetical protein ETD83_18035 [Actinomadura soli]|uniref:Uncharacterized protein n=1 Tax=Actinomadura soli TaxID=2508997 RepID=A0A5C4JB06_9ACTN|nr:hypothetical protein [Actinomadura soli]TMQ99253.1 hypothetical protein ETD83_18035 [Actinomadura soli]
MLREDGQAPIIGPSFPAPDIQLPTLRTLGYRKIGDRLVPILHTKMLLLGELWWHDEDELGGVDDVISFRPQRLWLASANGTSSSRENLEFGLWLDDPDAQPHQERIVLIRQPFTDDTPEPLDRVAGLLVLLYAQPVTRLAHLTIDAVTDDRVRLKIAEEDLPPPEPLTGLTASVVSQRRNMRAAANSTSPWLFPGRLAGRPISATRPRQRPRAVGITRADRTAALDQLLRDIPAPVLADLVGCNPRFAAERAATLATDWDHLRRTTSHGQAHCSPLRTEELKPQVREGLPDAVRPRRPVTRNSMAVDHPARHSVRMTSPKKPLLRPVAEDGDWRDTAIIGYFENDGTLAAGYLDAARVLVDHWTEHHPSDQLVLPALNLLRHGIELALKDQIREAAERVRADGITEPDLMPEAVDRRLSVTHSISGLVAELNAYLGRLQLGANDKLPDDTMEVLESLHLLDEKGQALRYSTVKTGKGKNSKLVPARPEQQAFNFPAVAATLHNAGTLILYGVSGVLGEYEDYQADMRQMYGETY